MDEVTAALVERDEVLQRLYRSYGAKDVHTMSAAQKLLDAYRAAVLRDAADAVARFTGNDLDANAKMLRRMADEAETAGR